MMDIFTELIEKSYYILYNRKWKNIYGEIWK